MNKTIYMLLLFVLSIGTECKSQNYSTSQLDSLLVEIKKFGDSIPLIAIAKGEEAFKSAEAIGYENGMVISALLVSKNLFDTNQYDKALEQVIKVENIALKINDTTVLSELYRLKGISYVGLGLFSQAFTEFQRGIKFANQIVDMDIEYKQKGLLCSDIAVAYDRSGKKVDLVLKYFKRSHELFNKIKDPRTKRTHLSLASANVGAAYLAMKQYDSATRYLTVALKLAEHENYNAPKLYAYLDLGQVRIEQNNLREAVNYFEKAHLLAKKLKNFDLLCHTYLKLYKTYELLDDHGKEEFYYKKYIILNDSLQKVTKNAALKTVKDLLAQKDDKDVSLKKNWRITLEVFVIITCILVFYTTRIYLVKKREKVYVAQNKQILNKNKQLLNRVSKTDQTAVIDYVELANRKDDQFLAVFKNYNTDFYNRFLEQFPDLNENEIKICAFLRLGFNVKDVATFTDVTIRSVESRVYRIRKKIQLSIKEDISLWILKY